MYYVLARYIYASYKRNSKQRGSNTSDVNRDNQDHGKRSRILAQIKALESEIVELQTEIDERRKERERVIPMDDIMYPRF